MTLEIETLKLKIILNRLSLFPLPTILII